MQKFKENAGLLALLLVGVMLGLGVATSNYPGRAAYGLTAPATGAFTPAQSDTVELTYVARGIKCEAAGDVKYKCIDGSDGTETVVAGERIPAQVVLIYDTGTTLTDAQMTCYR